MDTRLWGPRAGPDDEEGLLELLDAQPERVDHALLAVPELDRRLLDPLVGPTRVPVRRLLLPDLPGKFLVRRPLASGEGPVSVWDELELLPSPRSLPRPMHSATRPRRATFRPEACNRGDLKR